ncbi:Pol poly, partial [Paramuricea clavata]
ISVTSKVLQKLEQDKATGVIVIPKWPTQVWYSMAMRMLISCPVLLQHSVRLLLLPSHPQETHPLHKKLDLLLQTFSSELVDRANDSLTFETFELTLKLSRPGKHLKPIELEAFGQEQSLCIIHHLRAYIEKTANHRTDVNTSQLLLSYQKPFKPVSKDTISRWIKIVLKDAGIDTTKFTAHSARAASTSAAAKAGASIESILESAGWSNCGTFAKFYNKEINVSCNLGSVLLEANIELRLYSLSSLFFTTT